MPRLDEISLKRRYGGGRDDVLVRFYKPCLEASVQYDRAVGYFRATLLSIAGLAFSDFADRGGRARIVCSPSLNAQDAAAVIKGAQQRDNLSASLKSELQSLVSNPLNRPFLEFLGALVALDVVEIRVARRPGATGIYHEKVGVFIDSAGDTVSFEGSSNETWSAWDPNGNVEGFSVFASWRSTDQAAYTRDHTEYFEALWNGRIPGLDVVPLPQAVRDHLVSYAPIHDIDHYAEAVVRATKIVASTAPIGLPEMLQGHQRAVLNSWNAAGQSGIVKHATGAGKTITALEAIRQWGSTGRPALVLVPTNVLQKQWTKEIEKHLPAASAVLRSGGDTPKSIWRRHLGNWTTADDSMRWRIVVATMGTASTEAFRSRLNDGQHLLVVADEVHRLGSPVHQNSLSISAGGRLGLSATPERYNDAEGTRAIFDYFGDILEPEVSLEDAIRADRLVPYEYHIDVVSLNEDEQDAWKVLTSQIRAAVARLGEDGDIRSDEHLKRLFIRRSRIIKKAQAKIAATATLVSRMFRPGQAWILYCEDRDQMGDVVEGLGAEGLVADTYDSSMSSASQAATLEYFERNGGILVAIRCLDEGVDIPTVDHALILASSQNPRQFIQRRGRVLRKAPGKHKATIYDIFVTPHSNGERLEDDGLPIVRAEILRARTFAHSADNQAVMGTITSLMRALGIDPNALDISAYEEDEDESDEVGSDEMLE